MKTAQFKTAIFVTDIYNSIYVCYLSSLSYTHIMYEYLHLIISDTKPTICFLILNDSISLLCYCKTGTLLIFFVKLTYGRWG